MIQHKEQPSDCTATNLYVWRLNRHEVEKRTQTVNREILRRQHTN